MPEPGSPTFNSGLADCPNPVIPATTARATPAAALKAERSFIHTIVAERTVEVAHLLLAGRLLKAVNRESVSSATLIPGGNHAEISVSGVSRCCFGSIWRVLCDPGYERSVVGMRGLPGAERRCQRMHADSGTVLTRCDRCGRCVGCDRCGRGARVAAARI